MAALGRVALVLALLLLVYATVAGTVAALRRWRPLARSARNALIASCASTAVASAVLVVAFLSRDFSLVYVARHASRELPIPYTVAAFWSGQAGSLLLWLLILTGLASAAVLANRTLVRDVLPWTVPVLAGIGSFFALLLVAVSNPFETQSAPPDGAGMHPSLQNVYVLVHPPLLYLGYVGLTIPFGFAAAALLSGRVDERWVVATRRWTLLAWTFLGVGILVGAKWAYEEIGWGGYYAWDPVENAALMPWLASTAYLHSVIVQEKKDILRVWNVVLIALAFSLSLFGTFLTRSGVVNSVHSFTQSSIGAWFLGFIALVAGASTALILARLPLLRSRGRLESLVSRESAFLYNNLLLVALCLTVLWGVVFPLVTEAIRGTAVTVGPPYYNFFLKVFGLPLLLLMAIGPLVAWRRSSLRTVGRNVVWPAAAALLVGVLLAAGGAGSSVAGLLAYSFSAFVLSAIALEFFRGMRARRALGATSLLSALATLVERNRRRYGGYVVHAAVVLLAIGIAASSAYGARGEAKLRPGQTTTIRDYVLRYEGSFAQARQNAIELRARFTVFRDETRIGTITAGKNRYLAEQQTSNEVAIRSDWRRGEDLFLIAEQFDSDGSVWIKVLVNPLVNLIWLAGGFFLLGSAVAMWPDRRERRRLAERTALEPALAGTR